MFARSTEPSKSINCIALLCLAGCCAGATAPYGGGLVRYVHNRTITISDDYLPFHLFVTSIHTTLRHLTLCGYILYRMLIRTVSLWFSIYTYGREKVMKMYIENASNCSHLHMFGDISLLLNKRVCFEERL